MPKTDINTILKNGARTKAKNVDYTTKEMQKKLKELREKVNKVLKNIRTYK